MDAFNYQQGSLVRNVAATRQARHDMNNLLLSLRSSLEDGHVTQSITSIDAVLSEIKLSFVSNTGNNTIDSVINYKAKLAEEDGIIIHVYHKMFTPLNLNWVDIGVIISTALDNAIEACRKNTPPHRQIYVNIAVRSNMLTIIITNPFHGIVEQNACGDFETTKSNKDEHGFGLKGLRRLVEKNAGECEIMFENHAFSVSLVIPESVK